MIAALTAHRPGDRAARLRLWFEADDRSHRRRQLALAFAVFALAALAAYWPAFPGDSARVPAAGNSDATQDTWFLGWTAYALAHGLNIFYTQLINVPFGINTAQNTQMPLLGIIASPLTLATNPLASYTLLMWLAFPLSALSATFVLYRWCRWFPAAFLGGALYGFGPYLVNEGVAHLNLMFVPFPPLILMAAFELFVSGDRRIYWGGWLGVFFVLQYYVSPEIAASSVLVVGIGLALLTVLGWRSAMPALRRAAPGLAVAVLLVAIGVASPVWWMLDGVGHYSGRVSGAGNPFHADLLGAFIPTDGLRLYPASWKAAGSALLVDNSDENGSFLGVPLVAMLIGLVWLGRRNRWVLFGALMVPVAYLVSLGPSLTIDGHHTSVRLPMDLIANIALGDDILPARMSNYVMLLVATVVALGLAEWHRAPRSHAAGGQRWLLASAAVLAAVSLIPAWPYASWSSPAPGALLAALRQHVSSGATVLAYPYPSAVDDEAMLWQAVLGMDFRLVGAYALNPTPTGAVEPNSPSLSPAYVQAAFAYYPIETTSPGPALPLLPLVRAVAVRQFLTLNRIDDVVVDRSTPYSAEIEHLLSRSVGAPTFESASVAIWSRGGAWR